MSFRSEELPVDWANAVRLGLQMGDAFGRGLVSSSFKGPALRVTLRGDQPTSALALGAALRAAPGVRQVQVSQDYVIQLDEVQSKTRLDLTQSKLTEVDLMALASFGPKGARLIQLRTLVLAPTDITASVLKSVAPFVLRLEIAGYMIEAPCKLRRRGTRSPPRPRL